MNVKKLNEYRGIYLSKHYVTVLGRGWAWGLRGNINIAFMGKKGAREKKRDHTKKYLLVGGTLILLKVG